MAELTSGHDFVSPAQRTLANPSEQEALELDLTLSRSLALQSVPSTTQSESKLSRWWRRHIVIGVPHTKCRDHLANERTYLSYVRTGQAFAVLGVIVAQVLRIQHSLAPNPIIGFFVVSVPLSCVCLGTAIVISTLGALRFLRCQKEMARGYAVSGGWEIKCIGTLTTLVILSMFVLVLAITIEKG
ncbi:hypothetical protein A1O3_08550 [Capronia epimyces CBS 606.96]|uniref:DUF202 domain-containing protein n=1 Tax=Capronia epimyces CBS 606.96 TaxID=1182542 RepID=W9Y9I4_9EURO|nr:uncharacterized protein A1O3_08550 [Capronia epimyces CBS 606.96]EXJ79049.1 hypothetical protein A1O3_08550 [Capronia epimyces CBS 606.96]